MPFKEGWLHKKEDGFLGAITKHHAKLYNKKFIWCESDAVKDQLKPQGVVNMEF